MRGYGLTGLSCCALIVHTIPSWHHVQALGLGGEALAVVEAEEVGAA
jgi:hypothetical protein